MEKGICGCIYNSHKPLQRVLASVEGKGKGNLAGQESSHKAVKRVERFTIKPWILAPRLKNAMGSLD